MQPADATTALIYTPETCTPSGSIGRPMADRNRAVEIRPSPPMNSALLVATVSPTPAISRQSRLRRV
jgi:hypothetical protein